MSLVIHCVSLHRPEVTAPSTMPRTHSGVTLCVDEAERHAPRTPDDDPLVDAQVHSQALDVSDEMVGGVSRQVCVLVTGQGTAAPAPSLVEDDRPVVGGVEGAPAVRGGRPSWTAVQPNRRQAIRRADDLPVQGVTVADVEMTGVVGLDWRVHANDHPRGDRSVLKRRSTKLTEDFAAAGSQHVNVTPVLVQHGDELDDQLAGSSLRQPHRTVIRALSARPYLRGHVRAGKSAAGN